MPCAVATPKSRPSCSSDKMSDKTGSSLPTASQECSPRAMVKFLATESSRYIPFPAMKTCDAVFVNPWFEFNFFSPAEASLSGHVEPLLELMRNNFGCAAVLGIKHLMIYRHGRDNTKFRLRWTYQDQESSEVFLISFHGCPDHVAVVPTQYLRTRYGEDRSIEGGFELEQACPSLFAPFMVHHQHILKFLDRIYYHANKSNASDLINPTYLATYHGWRPELHFLRDVLPKDTFRTKLDSIQKLYFAFKPSETVFKLAPRGEAGHFSLNGSPIEYWRKVWKRRGYSRILIALKHKIPVKNSWKFLLLESNDGREAVFLPRNLVPPELIETTRREASKGSHNLPHYEASMEEWAPFTFTILGAGQYAAVLNALVTLHEKQADEKLESGYAESDSGCSTSSKTRETSGSWCSERISQDSPLYRS